MADYQDRARRFPEVARFVERGDKCNSERTHEAGASISKLPAEAAVSAVTSPARMKGSLTSP